MAARFDALRNHVSDLLSERLKPVRQQWRALRRAVADVEVQTNQTLERLGITPPKAEAEDVVDVGARPSVLKGLAKRSAQGLALVVSFAALGFALLSLGMFVGAAALAFLLITRGLGLRVDVARPA